MSPHRSTGNVAGSGPLSGRFLARRPGVALILAGTSALGYVTVLTLQHLADPRIGSSGLLACVWLLLAVGVVAVTTAVQHLARAAAAVEELHRLGFERSPVAAAFLDVDLTIVDLNDAMCRLLGRSREALLTHSIAELGGAGPEVWTSWRKVATGQESDGDEARFARPDGTAIWIEMTSAPVAPELVQPSRHCQFRDVSELHRYRESLARQEARDPLTGLYNRVWFTDRATAALERRGPGAGTVGLALVGFDGFKLVNDSLGHEVGDTVLTLLAHRLEAAVAPTDTIARLGGDQFIVLLDELGSPSDAAERADRLAEAMSAPFPLAHGGYVVTASIGISVASGGDDSAALLRHADAAMHRAKSAGRNRIEMFDNAMRFNALRRMQLEKELRSAIGAGDLLLEYQPVVDTTSGRPVSLEALVRWDHPHRGRLEPGEFIALAEETGLMIELGEWVLRSAVEQLSKWQLVYLSEPPIKVTVNISGSQLAAPEFAGFVARLLAASAIAPGSLGIEITESVILTVRPAFETLETLRAFGVVVLLDDFGTGYSSLAYLEQFPIDMLKIDRAFTARLDGDSARAVVLEAVFHLARSLGLPVVAEGVENAAQIAKLRELGCTWAQGRAVAPPLPAERVIAFLSEQQTVARASEPEDPGGPRR